MRTFAVIVLIALSQLSVFAQFWRPNSDGHFHPVLPDTQWLGSSTDRLAGAWINVARLKGPANQLVIDADAVGQRSTIIFQNQMTNVGAFTFRSGTLDNWYISGYGGAGESFNTYTGLETNSFLFGEQDGDIFTGRAGSTLYLTNSFYVPGKMLLPGFAVQSLLAAGTIIATNVNILVQGSGAARTLTSTPTIAAATLDTFIILTGNSDANTLTLQDESTLPGSLLRLQAATRTLGLYDKLGLMYSVAHSVWEEVFYSPGTAAGVDTDDQTAAEVVFTPTGNIAAINVQTAIAEVDTEKQVVITGSATTIDTETLTASRAVVTDGSGKIAVSSGVTAAELEFVADVTSAIQAQLDAKAPLKFFRVLSVSSPNLPGSAPAVIDSGLNRRVLSYDASSTQSANWSDIALTNYQGGTLFCDVYFSFASATSGTCQFRGYVDAVTPGTTNADSQSDSYDSANEGAVTTASASAGRIFKQTITLTNKDSAANGDLIVFKLDRDATDGTNDTATGNARVRAVVLYEL